MISTKSELLVFVLFLDPSQLWMDVSSGPALLEGQTVLLGQWGLVVVPDGGCQLLWLCLRCANPGVGL